MILFANIPIIRDYSNYSDYCKNYSKEKFFHFYYRILILDLIVQKKVYYNDIVFYLNFCLQLKYNFLWKAEK